MNCEVSVDAIQQRGKLFSNTIFFFYIEDVEIKNFFVMCLCFSECYPNWETDLEFLKFICILISDAEQIT